MPVIVLVLSATAALAAGAVLGYWSRQTLARKQAGTIEAKIAKLQEQAKEETRKLLLDAKTKSVRILESAEKEAKEWRGQLFREQEKIAKKEQALEQGFSNVERQEKELAAKVQQVRDIKANLEELKLKETEGLERIARLSRDEARNELLGRLEQGMGQELHDRLIKLEEDATDALKSRAKELIIGAAQRYASSQVAEITTTAVSLPSDDIKGRIIGKEGRNIKALERLTGVEIIVDDTPETVVLSAFDGVRRNIARLALEKLIKDGRIQPAKIEEKVAEAEREISQEIKSAGEAAAFDIQLIGLDPKLLMLLGRLKFRTSYGQNVLLHSLEVAHIASALAAEVGADAGTAKKAGLFHDIGKALDHQVEGTHVDIGIKILERFNIGQDVIYAMRSHHEEYPYETIESRVVQTADAISAARPGARKDTVENYLKRLSDLEGIASSFQGIEKAYAIQAGRELRIFVRAEELDDAAAKLLARDVANRIQDELKYPGEIKVTVIRETRAVDYAR